MGGLIVFLGPSLPAREARRVARCHLLPPARQGDVWRALVKKPRAIALIDGVFEAEPSVWHREILDALAEGVAVFGASSMGALRAAELWRFGMVPVGTIAARFKTGALNDDSDVALLHADAAHGHRALTVPLVDAQHAIDTAAKKRLVTRAEARALNAAASRLHYTERTWGRLTRAAGVSNEGWLAFVRASAPSLKAQDAQTCIAVAARWARSGSRLQTRTWPSGSSFQRRMRAVATGQPVPLPDPGAALGLAASIGIDPSGIQQFSHRLLNDGR